MCRDLPIRRVKRFPEHVKSFIVVRVDLSPGLACQQLGDLLPFVIPIQFLQHCYQQRQLAGILGLERLVRGSYDREFL